MYRTTESTPSCFSIFFLAITFLILNTCTGHAEEVPLFGPQAVVKESGSPAEVVFTFSAPLNRSGILKISSGLQDDPTNNQFVGTSLITLNGQAIISQGEMSPTITFLQEAVPLQAGTNTLGITL